LERISFDDAQILRLETEAIKGHTLKVLAVGPCADGSRIEAADLRASVAGRLDREVRSRQRVRFPAGAAGDAVWADDEEFDLANHVVAYEATEPVDPAGLLEIAARLFEQRLDHQRPLWRADVVPMSDGGSGIVLRIHHALADGITSQRFARALIWDTDPEPAADEPGEWAPGAQPSALGAATRSIRERVGNVPGAVAGALKGARDPSRWVHGAREVAKLPATVARELLPFGGETVLDRTIGPRREIACAVLHLDELKGVAHLGTSRLGSHVTLNDVLLTLVAGGLQSWLDGEGDSPAALRAQVPVSLHGRDHDDELGNRDSFLNVDLRLDAADALERLRLINAETATRKQAGDAETLYDFFHAISRFRPLYRGVTRISSGPRDFALSVSNVPGPREHVYVLGARATELFSIAEPADRHALRVSALSYAGTLTIGLSSDPEAVSGIGELAGAIESAAAELAAALAA
jgi:diacylglycerol O-acyltransferase